MAAQLLLQDHPYGGIVSPMLTESLSCIQSLGLLHVVLRSNACVFGDLI